MREEDSDQSRNTVDRRQCGGERRGKTFHSFRKLYVESGEHEVNVMKPLLDLKGYMCKSGFFCVDSVSDAALNGLFSQPNAAIWIIGVNFVVQNLSPTDFNRGLSFDRTPEFHML